MKTSELSTSKYLRQEDVEGEVEVTIVNVKKENVALPTEPVKLRGIIRFVEFEKAMVLNSTNRNRLEKAYGDETDDWTGRKCFLFVDEDVEYGGEIVGGLRLRVAKAGQQAKATQALEELENDIPQ